MKNLITKSLLLLTFFLGSNLIVLADAWTSVGSHCFFVSRYKAHAKVKREWAFNAHCKKEESSCAGTGAEVECQYPDPVPNNPFIVRYAYAYAIVNDYQQYQTYHGGYDGSDWWVAGSDVSNKIPDLSLHPMVEKVKGNNKRFSGGEMKVGKIVFDTINHTVQFLDVQGKFNSQSFNKANDFSAFAISITMSESPDDDFNDDDLYMKQLVWTSRAMINNGRLLFDGNFEESHFVTSNQDGADEAIVKIKSLVVSLPKNVDMRKLSVNTGLDNGNLGMGISSKFRTDKQARVRYISKSDVVEEEFNFTGFPNPNYGKFKVTVKLPTTQQIKVEVYDASGNFIKSLYVGEAKKESPVEIEADLATLLPGVYYLKLFTFDKVLVRKLIKQ